MEEHDALKACCAALEKLPSRESGFKVLFHVEDWWDGVSGIPAGIAALVTWAQRR